MEMGFEIIYIQIYTISLKVVSAKSAPINNMCKFIICFFMFCYKYMILFKSVKFFLKILNFYISYFCTLGETRTLTPFGTGV